jgi:hypothetical protein
MPPAVRIPRLWRGIPRLRMAWPSTRLCTSFRDPKRSAVLRSALSKNSFRRILSANLFGAPLPSPFRGVKSVGREQQLERECAAGLGELACCPALVPSAHSPEKWTPVFRKKMRQAKALARASPVRTWRTQTRSRLAPFAARIATARPRPNSCCRSTRPRC